MAKICGIDLRSHAAASALGTDLVDSVPSNYP